MNGFKDYWKAAVFLAASLTCIVLAVADKKNPSPYLAALIVIMFLWLSDV